MIITKTVNPKTKILNSIEIQNKKGNKKAIQSENSLPYLVFINLFSNFGYLSFSVVALAEMLNTQ